MYISGIIGDFKGVLFINESIIYLFEGVKKLFKIINEEVIYMLFIFLCILIYICMYIKSKLF